MVNSIDQSSSSCDGGIPVATATSATRLPRLCRGKGLTSHLPR
jgi:hypothetical protein